jgi:hypothetical protein
MSVLAPPRNPVGKKPGFSINALRLGAECFAPKDLWLLFALGKTKCIDIETRFFGKTGFLRCRPSTGIENVKITHH